MRAVATSCLVLGLFAAQASADPIGVGDIAVIGVAGDSSGSPTPFGDAFAWVPLINLTAGDVIFFSDSSWDTNVSNNFNQAEGAISFTVPVGGITAGTIFFVDVSSLPANHSNAGSAQTGTQSPMEISAFGDQIVVFIGSAGAPTFIFAVNSNSSNWIAAGATSTASNLYAGLINGVNAVAAGAGPNPGDEFDNAYYTGPTTGDKATLLAAISNSANWTGNNNGPSVSTTLTTAGQGVGGSFSVSPPPNGNGNRNGNGIPEPTTLALLALGVGVLMRRRGRAAWKSPPRSARGHGTTPRPPFFSWRAPEP